MAHTPTDFRTDAQVAPPALAHAPACRCALHGRRLFTGGLLAGGVATSAWAQQPPAPGTADGVRSDVGRESRFTKLAPADQVEAAAAQQYLQMTQGAAQKRALAPANHPQVVRLRSIAERIIPHALPWNPRAKQWKWEVNLIGDPTVNAFCMPGGKIAFYYGILDKLQLSDDEVATIMGHEVAHALREHARERMGKNMATRVGANLVSALFGLGQLGDSVVQMGGQLLTLQFGREDETEADIVGMDLAARAGYDPRAGVSLWTKMTAQSKGAPPQFLSTHPSGPTRIKDIESKLPKVAPLFEQAAKPTRRFGPPTPQQAPGGASAAQPATGN